MVLKLIALAQVIFSGIVVFPSTLFGVTDVESGNSRTVSIGFLDELTLKDGRTPSWGAFSLNGFKLGLKESLNHSKITFNIIAKNVSRSPIEAKIAAEELLNEKVDVIVGLREDGQALMVKSVTEGKVPFITSMASSDRLIGKDSLTISMALRNSKQIDALVAYIRPRLGKQKEIATIVTRNCTYCVDMNRMLEEKFANFGVKVKVVSNIMHGSPISSEVFNDLILDHKFIGLFTDEIESISLLKMLKTKGYRGNVFGGDSWPVPYLGPEFKLEEYGSMCLINSLSFDASASKEKSYFLEQYRLAYGTPGNDMAGLAYDTGLILGKAIIACTKHAPNTQNFSTCLPRKIKGQSLTGASGTFKVNSDGGRVSSTNHLKTFSKCPLK